MCERNQLPLSWAVTPTVYTLKSIYRNRYYVTVAEYKVAKETEKLELLGDDIDSLQIKSQG